MSKKIEIVELSKRLNDYSDRLYVTKTIKGTMNWILDEVHSLARMIVDSPGDVDIVAVMFQITEHANQLIVLNDDTNEKVESIEGDIDKTYQELIKLDRLEDK